MTKRTGAGKVTPPGADAAPQVGPELTEDGQLPVSFHCLAVEGMSTSDGRTIAADGLSHRALPISILAQYTNPGSEGGHKGAEIIGHLTEAWRKPGPEVQSLQTGKPFPEGTFVWQGKGVVDPDSHGGKLVAKGHLRGNSVDLSDVDYDETFADDGKAQINITRGVMAATTLCPIPAFADAYVQVGTDEALAAAATTTDDLTKLSDDELIERFNKAAEDEPARLGEYLAEAFQRNAARQAGPLQAASAAALVAAGYTAETFSPLVLPPWRSAELGDECGPCLAAEQDEGWTANADGTFSPTTSKRARALARGLAMPGDKADGSDAKYPIENQADLDKAAALKGNGDADPGKVVAHIRRSAKKLGLKVPDSLTASASGLPPVSIYGDPHLDTYTPITIGEPRADGRRELTGHIAPWTECHVGFSGTCVRPPHSRTDYARFATGAARAVDENGATRIMAVGHIAMSRDPAHGGHAPGTLSESDTVAFYDNHCTTVADVAAGEDAYGIWVHGLTVPSLTEAEVDRLLSSPPSGDWRGYRGNLELCAILSVNTPGYVVARSRVASGEPVSLVAAGHADAVALAGQRSGSSDVRTIIREELAAALSAGLRTPEQVRADMGLDTTAVPLADRKAAAVRAMRRSAAMAVVDPFQ